ncbi:hypothetical protein C8J56DRAFT_1058314 [Mycena floridula]|nr:hypothetical protein C8J56DRAFT_1058314 [Mycena floridula]
MALNAYPNRILGHPFKGNDDSRRSVIDYCVTSSDNIDSIREFSIGAHSCGWSDHTPLQLVTTTEAWNDNTKALRQAQKRKRSPAPLPTKSVLDQLLIETLKSVPTEKQLMIKAYGNVHILHNANPNSWTTETEAWIAFRGSSARRPAKIATYWGDNSKNNNSLIIEDVCAYNRASIIAILICLGTKKGPLAVFDFPQVHMPPKKEGFHVMFEPQTSSMAKEEHVICHRPWYLQCCGLRFKA